MCRSKWNRAKEIQVLSFTLWLRSHVVFTLLSHSRHFIEAHLVHCSVIVWCGLNLALGSREFIPEWALSGAGAMWLVACVAATEVPAQPRTRGLLLFTLQHLSVIFRMITRHCISQEANIKISSTFMKVQRFNNNMPPLGMPPLS